MQSADPSAQINVTRKQKRSPCTFLRPVRKQKNPVQLSARGPRIGILPPRLRVLLPSLFPRLYSRPRSDRRERANHISMTSSVQKRARARVEGWRGRATRKVLRRGVPELAGFTRAVTKHLLSLAAAPRTRLPQARLPLVCYCLFFYRLLSSSFSSSSSFFSSCLTLPHLPPLGPASSLVLVSRRFHMESRPYCSKSLHLLVATYYVRQKIKHIHFVKIPRRPRI